MQMACVQDRLEQFHMQLGHGLQMAGSSGRDHEDGVLFLFLSPTQV